MNKHSLYGSQASVGNVVARLQCWVTDGPLFDPQESVFSVLHRVQTESGTHPACLFDDHSVPIIQISMIAGLNLAVGMDIFLFGVLCVVR
jgi:hypothetical protein